MTYARTGESVRRSLTWDEITWPDDDYAAWVGTSPRLNVADAETAYAAIETPRTGFIESSPVVHFAPAVIDANTYARVQIRSRGDSSEFVLFWRAEDSEALYLVGQYFEVAADEWATVGLPPLFQYAADNGLETELSEFLPLAQSQGFDVYVFVDYFSASPGFDVSLIDVLGGRQIPTRVYPRADGLGMGAPRIMDNRSPYTSARVFGQI